MSMIKICFCIIKFISQLKLYNVYEIGLFTRIKMKIFGYTMIIIIKIGHTFGVVRKVHAM